jgi:DNA-binding MltR family transcriptional regulator
MDSDFDNETFCNFDKLKRELNARRFSEESVQFTDDAILNALKRLNEYGNIECCMDLNEINLRLQLMK